MSFFVLTRAGAKAIIRCGGILSEITELLAIIERNAMALDGDFNE